MQIRISLFVAAILSLLAALLWSSDSITLQGERTVYTVTCRNGAWQDQRCLGQLAAAERFRFRALKAHREVLFWTVGMAGRPSGKYADCVIEDGRNWTCKATPEAGSTVAVGMLHGVPVAAPGLTHAFHGVAKWRWWLLTWGVSVGSEAGL